MNVKEKVKKEPTLLLALTPVVLTVIILIFSVSVLKVDVQVPLILGTCITAFIAIVFLGYTWQDLEDGAIESLKSIMQAVLLLIIIGATIGTWIVGGVVPALVYYGLQILTPAFFLVACMILCSIVSLAAGGSWATVGTIGIALVGIAKGLDIPVGLAGGAIISGAYFGDKMSPLSDTTNLAAAIAGAKLTDHIKHMMYTTVIALSLIHISAAPWYRRIHSFSGSDGRPPFSIRTAGLSDRQGGSLFPGGSSCSPEILSPQPPLFPEDGLSHPGIQGYYPHQNSPEMSQAPYKNNG